MIALDVDVRDQLIAPESSVMDAGSMDTTDVIALRPGTQLRHRKCHTSQGLTLILPAVRMTACILVLLRVLVLPCLRFFVDVAKGSCRLRGAVDSCSNRSLISSAVASGLGCPVLPKDLGKITAIDGKPVGAVGAVQLCVFRQHDHVRLPEISAQFLVVDSLSTVGAGILIGLDIILSSGGVSCSMIVRMVSLQMWCLGREACLQLQRQLLWMPQRLKCQGMSQ